ncbi:MAG: NosD domain-containing protein [Candidatus Micrarchaeota archaeon]
MNTIFKNLFAALALLVSLSFSYNINTCQVITAPGTYFLTGDLSSPAGDCLTVQVDNVDIMCFDRTITAPSDSYGIRITEGRQSVHVYSCVLENSGVGLSAGGPGAESSDILVMNTISRNNGWGFVFARLTNSRVENSIASGNQQGFYMTESTGNSFVWNRAEGNSETGFYLGSSSGNTLTSNTASGNGREGFAVALESDNNVLDSNTASGNDVGFWIGGTGTLLPDGNQLAGNTVSGNNLGIQLVFTGSSNSVSGSTISDNSGGGIIVSRSPGVAVNSNTLTNNGGLPTNYGILLYLADGYTASDNSVSSSPRGMAVLNSNAGSLDNNYISGSTQTPLLVQDSTSNEIIGNTVEDSAPVQLRGDAADTSIMEFTMRGPAGEVMVHIPVYDGDYDITVASAPSSAPAGYTPLGRYVSVADVGGADLLWLGIQYEDSDVGTLDESTAIAMSWDGAWSTPAPQNTNIATNTVEMEDAGSGVFGLFARPITPPTPPSGGGTGGGGSSGGTTSGGRSGNGAPHVGVPYVPGGTGTTTTTTTTPAPSCTSDSGCASSEECSSGRCVALEAGSSCGTFDNHEWVDYECCDSSDCGTGEVCKANECVQMEPIGTTLSGSQPLTGTEASNQGLGRLLADVPWWVLLLLVLMIGGGIYARYRMSREGQPPEEGSEEYASEEELPPAEPEEE